MKWMIASDIHGSAYYCEKMVDAYQRENAQRLFLLGDILYHGPRNDLPRCYDPKKVIAMLSAIQEDVFSVRGNCDTEVDQMVLPFPVLADYCLMPEKGRLIFATHGHRYHAENLPPMHRGDILMHGHTHVPACEQVHDIWYLNPGSISIPKENSPHSYMTLESGVFLWKDLLTGEAYRRHAL